MVYSRKKILRNPYRFVKKKKQAQRPYNALQGENIAAPNSIRTERKSPPTLVDVSIKAANVLRSVQPNDDAREPGVFGSNSMYWQRLPSQSLSFESAEILTVQECTTNAAMYRNKAVRTTGLFVQRSLENEGSVLLKLRHPVEAKYLKANITGSGRLLVRSKAIISEPRVSMQPDIVRKRKDPWIGGKLSSKGSSILQPNRPVLLEVDVDPAVPGLGDLVAGSSMVMVIGTLLEDGRLLSRVIKRLEHFDPARHDMCLNARRQMIYKKQHRNASQTSHQLKGKQSSPIHGCGPPPYDSFI
ncbi:unnamed protein product [Cylindrotheca closterium]|uniref:Uncharacterized protein n=1 Tax=Cylindrotheca closterium TaxID=2856 RepID=A0AAD2CNC0_9STRA|nr:unnamed protein product [Cylindrotheca closterium]